VTCLDECERHRQEETARSHSGSERRCSEAAEDLPDGVGRRRTQRNGDVLRNVFLL
jgi:hypothetical protein